MTHPATTPPTAPPTLDGFTILYQDDRLLAVEKPEGIAAIPESALDRASLRSRLEAAGGARLFVVHRLDKDVSGVIVFARDAGTHRILNTLFSERQVHKSYLLVTHGVFDRTRGTIDRAVREFGSGRMGVDRARGKPALTRYRVVRALPAHTLVEAEPTTGRRHQLRVHFYSIGHPIVGDPRYGDASQQRPFARLMLHATAIRFTLPDGSKLAIESPLPPSFRAILQTLEG